MLAEQELTTKKMWEEHQNMKDQSDRETSLQKDKETYQRLLISQ